MFTIHFRIYYSLIHISLFTYTYLLLHIYYSFTYLLFISLCTMHYALCTIHYALCIIYYALCTIRYLLCTMHYALFICIHTYSLFYTYSYVFTIHVTKSPPLNKISSSKFTLVKQLRILMSHRFFTFPSSFFGLVISP